VDVTDETVQARNLPVHQYNRDLRPGLDVNRRAATARLEPRPS
jgi:hypothetical protein